MELSKLKQIIEAALMASGDVLTVERLQLLFEEYEKPKSPVIKEALESLMEDFSGRGIELVEVASGYRFQVCKDVAPWVTRLWDEKPARYSRALLETMSLIAYRQPITRGDIEDVRGVAVSSNIIRTLLDREWVRVVGHRDVPGRPAMYATTKEFLDYFSLKSLDELPSLDEIREIDDANENLDLINAEKQASVSREYDFANKDDVEARGEEVLAETELELEEAQKLIDQVEDNVFNKPSEEELAADRETERQAKAEEERKLADKYAQPSFSDMANRTQQRLSGELKETPSVVDLADKIAGHQARLAGNNEDVSLKGSTNGQAEGESSGTGQPEEELTLLQQQERLMQQLMQQESERQSKQVSKYGEESVADNPAGYALENVEVYSTDQNVGVEKELLAQEAVIERELIEQEALEREQQEQEALEQEALEKVSFEEELLEKERLAEEALEHELGLENDSLEDASLIQSSSTKKNSLFDD